MKISFIIVNYKSEKYLQKCLSSIKEKVLGMDYEIIVVNNDKKIPLDYPENLFPNKIMLINTEKNVGFGVGCNMGAKIAQGEILCFLNPDTEIISKNIIKLIQEFNNREKIAIIGPRLIDETGATQEWIAGKEINVLGVILNNLGYKRDKKVWESKTTLECDWVSGAAMFIRRKIFQKIGGFDEKFFMYFEDVDLCRRTRCQLGCKVLYYPELLIKHPGGKSFFNKKTQKRYYRKSQWRYFQKYFCQ